MGSIIRDAASLASRAGAGLGPLAGAPEDRATPSPSRPVDVPPPLVTLAIVGGGYAILFVAAILAQVPVRLIDYRTLGLDFADFWSAAVDVLAGRDPYGRARFVTPPLSWLPFLPLASLPRPLATTVFFCCNGAALAGGLAWLARAFALARPLAVTVALVCVLSPATLMLLERGNIDGLVFLSLCAFMVLDSEGWTGPLALAVASGLKAYPGVFVLALLAQGRIKAAAVVGGALLAMVAAMPSGDLSFLHSQMVRAGGMRIDENLSALVPFWVLDTLLNPGAEAGILRHPAMLLGVGAYAASLAACLWLDTRMVRHLGRADRRLLLASYAVFCVSMPSLVYLYSGVCLFILLVAIGQDGLTVAPRRLARIAVALGVTMLPARSLDLSLGTDWAGATNLLPPLGSVLLILAAIDLRFGLRERLASVGR